MREEVIFYSDARPVISLSTPTNVTVDLTLYGILGVRWQIEGLSWDAAECGTKKISLPRDKIWIPDIVINEFMDENRAPETYYVYVTNTGTVLDGRPFHVISSCRLDIYTFPFDFQNCTYTFNSYKHSRDDVQLFFLLPVEQIFKNSLEAITTKGEWELIDMRAEKPLLLFLDGGWDNLIIVLRRRATLYVVNLLIPSSFLLSLDLFSFLLPPQSVDRASFKMTLILGYTVFLLLMNDLLPVTGNNLPLITSLLETIFITNILYGSRDLPPLPKWLRILVLKYFARIACMKKPCDRHLEGENRSESIFYKNPMTDNAMTDIPKKELVGASSVRVWDQCFDEMKKMSQDLLAIRHQVEEHLNNDNKTDDWMMFGQVIDRVLFIMYSLFIVVSLSTIMVLWLYSYMSCLANMLRCEEGQSGPTYESLQEVIDKKSFRPSVNLSTPTIANISFTLYAILGVNEKTQILTTFLWLRLFWSHDFLIWDSEACGGITKISLPDFPYAYVNHTGHIRYDKMLRLVSACNLEIFSFPFDIQNCTFTFGSYMHTSNEMTENSKRYLQASGEWELVVILGNTTILKFGIDEWDIITFWVVIKRRPILYVVNLIIPSSFLMIIDILSFFLPPHSVDRSSFKMTLILGYTVFLLIMNDLLPSTANGTPLIGIYFSVCLALMTISLLETVLVTYVLHHNSMKYKEVPHWVQVLVMRFIARLICYNFPEDLVAKVEEKQETNPWMNTYLSILRKEDHLQNQWCHVGYILDIVLFLSCLANMLRCEQGQSGPTYESLQEVIDKKSFRPSVNLSTPTITNISFTLYAILGVNEKAQILTTFLWLRLYWFHEFLIWDSEACDGITKISLPVKDLWTPDIIVYEFVDDDVSQACPYVYVNHTGHIRYDRMLRLVSACNLQIFSFPFDIQNCSFTFGSYMHTSNEMTGNSKRYLQASGEWELVVILGDADILKFGIDEWDIITFWVVIKRRPILYVVNLIIPSSFLMIIDILSFYLPPHSVDRSSFKMTLILGYTVFLLIMNDLLPSTANGTPLIGIYFSVCLALMTISLLETVLITCVLHHNSMKYREVPHWVQVLVMRFIARLICYSFPEDPLAKLEEKQETNPWVVQPSESTQISQDLREMNTYLSILRKEDHLQNQWCHVGYILDFLLFRVYLLIITGYALVIICMWCIWMNQ
ncbi:5-hydroxytryptamine receptor 3C [Labeo rohita]|uniref:5-hydroxytryptamine receptor 3C n=2 Tax=Labeonini TaxID=2743697 RepID=A0ABQ8LIC6_LABRO|nr:5-hydroxytryptamine receptor 3C [Labeo rohita]